MNEYLKNGNRVALSELELPHDLKKLSFQQCKYLCSEIRSLLINTVSKTGGHLSSNLGVVELTMAIHRIFDCPDDKIVWDVGHQVYVHKILTGRAEMFGTLRQENGLSGFPKPEESPYDTFISGHSSTSLSVACGIAEAMRLQEKENYTIAVIGDGAMTGGMVYEAMNNCCYEKSNMIVILNDNNMSISKSVGSLEKYLTTLRNSEKYVDTKRRVEKNLSHIPVVGNKVAKGMKQAKDAIKSTIFERNLFEDMGFIYLGIIDGHSLKDLEQTLRLAKTFHKPVFVHIKTVKGKGYLPAEKNPGEYHGISQFDIVTGNPEISAGDSYSTVFGKELVSIGEKDERICAITAAMKYGTGLQYFGRRFPERFYDVGIAEQHAVTFAGGLSSMGMIPVFAVYSTFLQRAYDQLMHDIAIGGLHLVLGIDRAGIVGSDGETHQGIFDVPMITSVPNAVIYSPSCYEELRLCLRKAVYDEKGLVAVRYPRGAEEMSFGKNLINTDYLFVRSRKSETLIVSYGRIFNESFRAGEILSAENVSCDLLKLTRIFPLSEKMIDEMMKYENIFFFEESADCGSISEKVGCLLMKKGYKGRYDCVSARGFIKQSSVRSALEKFSLTGQKIADYIIKTGSGENGTS